MAKLFRESDGGFKNLPIELYATDSGYHVFDAKNVVFHDVDEVVYGILTLLREKDLGIKQLISLLPQYPKEEIRDAFKEIKKLNLRSLVAIVTAYPESELLAEAMKLGPLTVILKPFDLTEIQKSVESLALMTSRS